MMGLDNPIHIAFLLILLLLVFGAKRLPELGRSLGTGMRGFKESLGGESISPTEPHEQAQIVAASAVADAGAPATASQAPASRAPAVASLDRQRA